MEEDKPLTDKEKEEVNAELKRMFIEDTIREQDNERRATIFDSWFDDNRYNLMRDFVEEHQAEFDTFCKDAFKTR